jgi:hypothetical protein
VLRNVVAAIDRHRESVGELLDEIEMKLRTVVNDTAKQRSVDQPIFAPHALTLSRSLWG